MRECGSRLLGQEESAAAAVATRRIPNKERMGALQLLELLLEPSPSTAAAAAVRKIGRLRQISGDDN